MRIETPTQSAYLALVKEICGPCTAAYRYFLLACEAGLLWDHIVDGDPIDRSRADEVFAAITTDLVFNDWYIANRLYLTALQIDAIAAWKFGNRDNNYQFYRSLPLGLATILHGYSGAMKWAPKIYEIVGCEEWEDTRRDNKPFFIVGLPRTRSAWFAAFLTDGAVTCHHELIRNCDKAEDYPAALTATKSPIVGDSDPTLALYYHGLKDKLPAHKVIFIERDPQAAQVAFCAMLREHGLNESRWGGDEVWQAATDAFSAMKAECPDAMSFKYEDLDKPEVIREISEYCTGLPFNEERWKIFNELKITAIPAKVMANQRIIK